MGKRACVVATAFIISVAFTLWLMNKKHPRVYDYAIDTPNLAKEASDVSIDRIHDRFPYPSDDEDYSTDYYVIADEDRDDTITLHTRKNEEDDFYFTIY